MPKLTLTVTADSRDELMQTLQTLIGTLTDTSAPAPAAPAAPAAAPAQPTTPAVTPTDPPITRETLRAQLAELTQAGKLEAVKQLFAEYGASKLSEVPEQHYGDLSKQAQALA